MLNGVLKALGKSLLIVTGVGYGVVQGLEAFSAPGNKNSEPEPDLPPPARPAPHPAPVVTPPPPDPLRRLDDRLDTIETRLARLDTIETRLARLDTIETRLARLDSIETRLARLESRHHDGFVTQADLESQLEHRFDVQNRAVQSLRAMVSRTDELLERVIENIESMNVTA